ncbi:MAG: glycosyltransferase [Candidatus Doudnabacteria bacterium]|nr:glycosyltransferase [Candidatus Doudnabacteria bacterium]
MLKYFLNKIHPKIKGSSKVYWYLREWYVLWSVRLTGLFDSPKKQKKRLLFYELAGMGYGGTEAFLQILAKHVNKNEYDVYFMYSDKVADGAGIEDYTSRLDFIVKGGVIPIRFDYTGKSSLPPSIVYGMSPDIFTIIKCLQIDLLVVAGAGHADFPFTAVRNIPIIFLNVFGQPNVQKNVTYHLCISQEVANKLNPIVPKEKILVTYVPSELPLAGSEEAGKRLRESLGIPDNALVFGRIGRSSNGIFDPIGIRAFQVIIKKYPNTHYLIVSPASDLREIVEREKIPNVHFVSGSGRMEDLWSFYYAFDVLAHFRHDGESFGLNIVQAMLCSRPVISHKSKYWNAHLEYLTDEFSRVAEIDNIVQYASFMELFINQWQAGKLAAMGEKARKVAEELISVDKHVKTFEQCVKNSLLNK